MLDSDKKTEEEKVTPQQSIKKDDHNPDLPWYMQGQKEVMTEKQAQGDVLHWLNSKNLSMRKRHDRGEYIETMVTAFQEGDMSLDRETDELTLKLRTPYKEIKKMTFPHRKHVSEFTRMYEKHKISADDGAKRIKAAAAVLTGLSMSDLSSMEQDDYDLVGTIAVFFM